MNLRSSLAHAALRGTLPEFCALNTPAPSGPSDVRSSDTVTPLAARGGPANWCGLDRSARTMLFAS
ncbi:MAG: hypothetical protein ACYSWW_15410 [Planctomycetota bacterium]